MPTCGARTPACLAFRDIPPLSMPPATGLTAEQRDILRLLADAQVPLCSECIARATQTSHNATKVTLRRLRDRGLVDRSGDGAYLARAAAREVLARA